MNSLLTAMSTDMNITRFKGECEESFIYRCCYSALGQWCLYTAQNSSESVIGTTKHNQTIVLSRLLEKFITLFPFLSDRFTTQQIDFPVKVRRVYEETGYLITAHDNHNRLANFGRNIKIGSSALFFGLSNKRTVNGLGVYTSPTEYVVSINDFLIRDSLTCEEYIRSRFNPIDFYDKDIDLYELEFFNPCSNNVPSQSWEKQPKTDCTMARKSKTGPFYRMMRNANSFQFADEPIEQQDDSFTSYEYRRLYFALKSHYKQPLKARLTQYDATHSRLSIRGYLPNREYHLMLLLAWPENNAFNRVDFIVQTDFLPEVTAMLENIGVEIKENGK